MISVRTILDLAMSSPAFQLQPIENTDRGHLSEAAMRTFLNIAEAWQIPVEAQRALLGGPSFR
jgi:hypothetical protein